jgi:hypothetical protein
VIAETRLAACITGNRTCLAIDRGIGGGPVLIPRAPVRASIPNVSFLPTNVIPDKLITYQPTEFGSEFAVRSSEPERSVLNIEL